MQNSKAKGTPQRKQQSLAKGKASAKRNGKYAVPTVAKVGSCLHNAGDAVCLGTDTCVTGFAGGSHRRQAMSHLHCTLDALPDSDTLHCMSLIVHAAGSTDATRIVAGTLSKPAIAIAKNPCNEAGDDGSLADITNIFGAPVPHVGCMRCCTLH